MAAGEPLPIQWQTSLGGYYWESVKAVRQTRDGGYLTLVETSSDPSLSGALLGSKTNPGYGGYDIWLVKLDANGVDQWDCSFGGNHDDLPVDFFQSSDGGFVVAGSSSSDRKNPNMSGRSRGASDFWVIKLDEAGQPLWDRTFGGSGDEYLSCLHATADGGCLLGGVSASGVSGNRTIPNRGERDFWVMKLDSLGNKQWEQSFGGTGGEFFKTIIPTLDGGFALGGHLEAGAGGTASFGSRDFLLAKLDSLRSRHWTRNYGGSSYDNLGRVRQTADGGYILGGETASGISGNKTTASFGNGDIWVVKADATGNKQWDTTLGGSTPVSPGSAAWEWFGDVHQTPDGGFLVGGSSGSAISGNRASQPFGSLDGWLVKLAANGDKEWDRTFGGNWNDTCAVIEPTKDGGFVLGLSSSSSISGNRTARNFGGDDLLTTSYDAWIVKLGGIETSQVPALTAAVLPAQQVVAATSNATFSIIATGLAPVTYQWRNDGTNLAGAVSRRLRVGAVQLQDAGQYSVVVSDARGSITSAPAILQVSASTLLHPPQRLGSGAFRVRLQNSDGRPMFASDASFFEIYASTNLNGPNWQRLTGNLALTNGQLYLDDPAIAGLPSRFYRVKQR